MKNSKMLQKMISSEILN